MTEHPDKNVLTLADNFSLFHTVGIKRKDSPVLLISYKKHIVAFSHKSRKHCLLTILNESKRLNIVTNINLHH